MSADLKYLIVPVAYNEEKKNTIGIRTTVTICDNVVIGAGAVVTKDIKEPGVYTGSPTRLLRAHRPS